MFCSFTAVAFFVFRLPPVNSWASRPRLLTLPTDGKDLRPGFFAKGTRAARVGSLTIVAVGLHAKGRLSFKTGVFGAIEPPKAACRTLWDKNKNSEP